MKGCTCHLKFCTETKEKKKKDRCVASCKNAADGDYQSCRGCDVYVSCVGGIIYDNRPCTEQNGVVVKISDSS